MEGYILLHRKLFDNPLYVSEPFNRALAWIDLLLLANYRESYYYVRGVKITVKRGQLGWGLDKLANRWRWSRGKVERFLCDLETEQQIVRQKNNVTTLISITNYEDYQTNGKADNKANSKASSKADGHIIKKDNKDKEVYGEFVTMTTKEHNELTKRFGKERTMAAIVKLDNYKGSSGKKYASDYRAILTWVIDDIPITKKHNIV